MKKEITLSPAFDKRHKNPSLNYGVHCVDMRFILQGELGAVTFTVFTGWYLPHVEAEFKDGGLCEATGADISYHSPTPLFEDQTSHKCDILPGKLCYCDGSGLQAIKLFDKLKKEGSEAVWKELETYYKAWLGALK